MFRVDLPRDRSAHLARRAAAGLAALAILGFSASASAHPGHAPLVHAPLHGGELAAAVLAVAGVLGLFLRSARRRLR